MTTRILDLNNAEYQFSLSKVSKNIWERLAIYVLADSVSEIRVFENVNFKVTIRDNKAKIKISYQDGKYIEKCFHVDEFGIVEHGYDDMASHAWQDMMSVCFGKRYQEVLKNQINSGKTV